LSEPPDNTDLDSQVEAFRERLGQEGLGALWDDRTSDDVKSIYTALLACAGDELYLQEFLPYGIVYRTAGELGARRRSAGATADQVMQEHLLLRDVFWEFRGARGERVHDFAVEKRLLQCFNSLLQATVQSYRAREPVSDVLGPLRDRQTGVFNSQYFTARLEEEVRRSERYIHDATVAMFEVDSSFDRGSRGQAELMRAVARVLRRNSRASDVLARLDDSRFAMLLPETGYEVAEHITGRLRTRLKEYLSGLGEEYGRAGIGSGLATYPQDAGEVTRLIEQAAGSMRREATGSA
jgi:diguanylate cyclase (GGDEF)-like protein